MTYNPRRKILGALPLSQKIAYHLFSVDGYTSKTEEKVKLYRKSRWHSQDRIFNQGNLTSAFFFLTNHTFCYIDNIVTGFDFDPTGERAATIDIGRICSVSEINTNLCSFRMDTEN